MTNTQHPESLTKRDDGVLDVHSIFLTIQGEGPFRGYPAVFIRLAGCNLQCPACDTQYTDQRRWLGVLEILHEVNHLALVMPKFLVVITGGEPFRQNISELCDSLCNSGYTVQIETNGVTPPPENLHPSVVIVCSPKGRRVVLALLHRINAYKYVLDHRAINLSDGLPTSVLGYKHEPARPHDGYKGPIYLSPMDVGPNGGEGGLSAEQLNNRNTSAVADICMRFGYILNLQLHKLVGLP